MPINQTQPIVYVIDDDALVRDSVVALLRSVDIEAKSFGSVSEFFEYKRSPNRPSCLVVDVRLPGRSGLEFQSQLNAANIHLPVVVMTGHADVSMAVKAMKAGAIEFLLKPIRDQDLLDAVQSGLEQNSIKQKREDDLSELRSRFDILSSREREIMRLVTSGFMNKQIAGQIGVSEVTVKVSRGNLMRKLGAKSLADLIRIADILNVGHSTL